MIAGMMTGSYARRGSEGALWGSSAGAGYTGVRAGYPKWGCSGGVVLDRVVARPCMLSGGTFYAVQNVFRLFVGKSNSMPGFQPPPCKEAR